MQRARLHLAVGGREREGEDEKEKRRRSAIATLNDVDVEKERVREITFFYGIILHARRMQEAKDEATGVTAHIRNGGKRETAVCLSSRKEKKNKTQ